MQRMVVYVDSNEELEEEELKEMSIAHADFVMSTLKGVKSDRSFPPTDKKATFVTINFPPINPLDNAIALMVVGIKDKQD